MDSTKPTRRSKMESSNSRISFLSSRNSDNSRVRYSNHNNKNNKLKHYNRNYNYIWAIALFLCPVKTLANTTVASPSSNAQGVVNNNATMITPSAMPSFRMSQGIVCASPSLTITPYVTDAWSFNRPIEQVTRPVSYTHLTLPTKRIV